MSRRERRDQEGFTLMELLVVISIIILMMAMAIPAMTSLIRGRTLESAGRSVQSVLNFARRQAITQRIPHRVILYIREERVGERIETLYGMRVYADGEGYVGEALTLPSGLRFDTRAQGLPVLDRLPPADSDYFDKQSNPGRLEYRTDGTANFEAPWEDTRSNPQGYPDIYDVNQDVTDVPEDFPADMVIVQPGLARRCFIDITPNTGRVNMRVLEVEGQMGGSE